MDEPSGETEEIGEVVGENWYQNSIDPFEFNMTPYRRVGYGSSYVQQFFSAYSFLINSS